MHSDPKKRPARTPKPYRYPRPAAELLPRARSTIAEIRRFFRGK